jgi:Histidine kinase-, DNA gyrase B-, and HSP90-like ATPase
MTLRYASTGSAHPLRHQFGVPPIPSFGRVPLLVDLTNFDDKTEGDVAFSIESSNRKPAELQTRDWYCREVRFAPPHANCTATLEELSACTVHEIKQLGNRIVEIVDHARALVQRVAPRKDDFEINEAIQETISLNQDAVVKNDVSVHTRLAHGLPLVRADRVQLQQVILNLITNAVEAMSAVSEGTRELCVSSGRTHSGDILVAVQDSGPGLDTQNLDRVFDAFYSTKPRGLASGFPFVARSSRHTKGGCGHAGPSRTVPYFNSRYRRFLSLIRSAASACSLPSSTVSKPIHDARLSTTRRGRHHD